MNTRITFNVPEERAYDKGAYDLETLALYVQHVAGSNVYMGLHGNWSDARIPRAGATHDRVLFINVRCRIEISQIVTIQSVNARNQVNYAPPPPSVEWLISRGKPSILRVVLKRTNCLPLRLKVDYDG